MTNAHSDTTTLTTTQTIVFEPTSAGGGSLWDGDSLLATLTVIKRAGRQGRLSIRDTNRAMDLLRLSRRERTIYRLVQALGQIGEAEWVRGEPSALLRYRGQAYLVTRDSLLTVQDHQPVVALALASNWNVKQMELRIAPEADWALVGFYLFIIYDLNFAGQ
jgi:hypothetical protein